MNDLLGLVSKTFNLPATDGTLLGNPSVSLDKAGTTDDMMPDGSMVIRGLVGRPFSIDNISISAVNPDPSSVSPTAFNANLGFTQVQTACDPIIHSTSIVVYDKIGEAHTITTTFICKIGGVWQWEITTNSGEEILHGNSGLLTFGQDGSPASVTFTDNTTQFSFKVLVGCDSMKDSNCVSGLYDTVSLKPDFGSPGSFTGLTQFRSDVSAQAKEQDGYPSGVFSSFSIDETGMIIVSFTNGVNLDMFRIPLAFFINPSGLDKMGNYYKESSRSGPAVIKLLPAPDTTKIMPGALELSPTD